MITAKISAAIRKGSPVYMETPHGNMVDGVALRLQPEDRTICVIDGDEDIWNVPSALVSLVISDPTGAAHLAWWLLYQTPSRTGEQHAERLEAIGWTANGYAVHVDLAARGLGVGSVALGFLRDYAHHIAGVTNG